MPSPHSEQRAFVRLRRPSYFLFAWPKRKITKEKCHPAWRLPGFLPGKSVSRGRAFRTGILPVRKGVDIPVDSRFAACRPRLTAAQGPQVEQRAIVARTPQKSQGNSRKCRELQSLVHLKMHSAAASVDSLLSTRSGHLLAEGVPIGRVERSAHVERSSQCVCTDP
jgi:hypothetical protein